MGKYTWIFDAGHGGLINGVYQTDPTKWKKSYFKNGILLDPKRNSEWLEANCDFKYYEGVGNRDIVKRIKALCDQHNIKWIDAVNSEADTSLEARVKIANDFYAKDKNCIYMSIHGNAFTNQKAEGFCVFTTLGFSNSDKIATILFKEIALEFPDYKPRPDPSDGDPDQEANFYVIKNTKMPAVLSESFFYTNWEEAQLLGSEDGRQRIANAHFRAIMYIEKNGI